jgi:hypothetical protein
VLLAVINMADAVALAVRRFRYAQATKPPRYLMRILPDSLERRTHASLLTQRELSEGGKT